jgi:hypothetical protein
MSPGNVATTLASCSKGAKIFYISPEKRKKSEIILVSNCSVDFNADPGPAYLNADPDPGTQTNADPGEYESGSWSDFKVTKS